MRRIICIGIAVLAFTSVACPPAPAPIDSPKKIDEPPGEISITPLDSLNQLKPRLEAALESARDWPLSTKAYGFWTVFHAILGLGPDHAMLVDAKTDKKVNAMQYICDG